MGNIPRSYAAGAFFLTLDGTPCGFLHSASGGNAVADVITVDAGPGQFPDKHVGDVHYEDLVLEIGLGLAKELYEWIDATWQLQAVRKGGTVAAATQNLSVQFEQTFTDAVVSEVTFPKLDGASKDAAFLTVKLAPEQAAVTKGGGTLRARTPKQKLWTAANFRFDLDGLETKQVATIESFTVRQSAASHQTGERREVAEPTTVEFPNLKVTLAAASADSWSKWFEDFVIQGNNGAGQERSGAITFFGPDMSELARVELANVGIVALRRPAAAAGADQVARVVAELYCERMSLKLG
jgi:T4-like virus tail tube protein gp19